MPQQVCNGAILQCTMGVAPSSLVVLPANRVTTGNQPDANILDSKPMVNIMPFGMCISPANPSVAAATAAAFGALTPMPCLPVTVAPWTPGAAKVFLAGSPTLDNTCTLLCSWGGTIQVINPGELTVSVP
jgi:hypothetical protein